MAPRADCGVVTAATARGPIGRSWPLRVTLCYVLVGGLWIVASDSLANWLFGDLATLAIAQTVKGLAYIVLSGALVYWLAREALKSVASAFERRELAALRELHERVLDAVGEAVIALDPGNGRIVSVNRATEQLFDYAPHDLLGDTVDKLFDGAAQRAALERTRRAATPDGDSVTLRAALRRRDGAALTADVIITRTTRADPTRGALDIVVVRDMTREIEALARVTDDERRFRHLFEHNPVPMWIYRRDDLAFLAVNDAAIADYGYSREEFLGMTIADIRPREDIALVRAEVARLNDGLRKPEIWRHRTRDGTLKHVRISSHGTEMDGQPARFVAAWDVTEQVRSETALRESEQRFRHLTQATLDAAWDWDCTTGSLWWSEGLRAVFGYDAADVTGMLEFWRDCVHPDDSPGVVASFTALLASDRNDWEQRCRLRRKDGSHAAVVARGFVTRGGDGRALRVVGGINDVTQETRLAERLHQAERMEAVGRLTGGVAHDFNNLLTVILANARLLVRRAGEPTRVAAASEMIAAAAKRGADLTGKLLAFARRQPLDPQNVDVGALLGEMQFLLRGSLGENFPVELASGDGLWPALVDPGQLEASVLNLCFNARDAMPGGGVIRVTASNRTVTAGDTVGEGDLAPGDYVEIVVSDAGEGIAPQELEHVFEPFFSTKTSTKGTGLGLASVYGFARQSGGDVAITSALGHGTTVHLWLPRARSVTEPRERELPPSLLADGRRQCTVLVVEDDALVRECAVEQLGYLGYRVLEAGNGTQALAVLDAHADIDLLFTDIIMPGGMNGRELAAAALRMRPDLRVLYASGYTDSIMAGSGADEAILLGKPYELDALAARVREALDRPAPGKEPTQS